MPAVCKTSFHPDYRDMLKESNLRNETNDCAVVAVSIACGISYADAHAALKAQGRKDRGATLRKATMDTIIALGFSVRRWSFIETQAVIKRYPGVHSRLQNVTSHHPRRFAKAWATAPANLLFFSQSHVLSVKDGVVRDWSVNRSLHIREIWEVRKIACRG